MEVVKALSRPTEFWAMLRVKQQQKAMDLCIDQAQDFDLYYCYEKLKQVSRSFAAVIIQLDPKVRDAVCIFYLVLRALDSIEDDMSYPKEKKIPQLKEFYKTLDQPDWSLEGVGEKPAEKDLLANYFRVVSVYNRLEASLRPTIQDICKKMGEGMAEYIEKEGNVQTVAEYEQYCHFVAGLVGWGLSELFAYSGLECRVLAERQDIANSMGLFLQKTNIIRDYLEDIMEEPPRMFWPRDIWGRFTDDFHSFKSPQNREAALQCLNAMVLDALKHLPDCMEYLTMLRDPTVFKFCAIPQAMAIATLTLLYNNGEVFEREVKIRKGIACTLILYSCGDIVEVRKAFQQFIDELLQKLVPTDPSFEQTMELLKKFSDANVAALKDELGDYVHDGGMTRNVITSYGPLGGKLLYSMLDALGLNGSSA